MGRERWTERENERQGRVKGEGESTAYKNYKGNHYCIKNKCICTGT